LTAAPLTEILVPEGRTTPEFISLYARDEMNKKQLEFRNALVVLLGELIENKPADKRICTHIEYLYPIITPFKLSAFYDWKRKVFEDWCFKNNLPDSYIFPLDDSNRHKNYWIGEPGEKRRDLCITMLRRIDEIQWR